MDDEPMWVADHVVILTLGFAITILETANGLAIKGNHLTLVKENQFDGRIQTDPHKHIYKFLVICNMFKYRDTENEAIRLMMFPLSLTGEAKTWLDELKEGTIKTLDELRITFICRFFPLALVDRLLGKIRAFSQHENETITEAWLRMKEMLRNCHGHNLSKGSVIKIFNHGLNKITQEVLNVTAGDTLMDLKAKLETTTKNHQASIQDLEAKFDRFVDKQSGQPSGSLPSNTQPNPKGSSSKNYQPPQAQNEHVNFVFTQSGKSYDPPTNLNDQPNDFKTPIIFDSDDEDEEPISQPKPKDPKPVNASKKRKWKPRLLDPNGGSGGKFKEGFKGNVGGCGCNGEREGSIAERGRGSLAKHSMKLKDEGGVENKSSVGSKFIASGEECLDGWIGSGRGEVKGGGLDFGVSRTFLGEILREIIKESGGKVFGVNGGSV
uniref:Reverse transcriptase domain-containing protein n=1 Tax=Tanacetum cinerariifolium TaxID=118510 RepID=A0A6L2L1Z0_TANCI|nr:reverse transcriptase domain-containing protein [Tanacetum cinerariifolium]